MKKQAKAKGVKPQTLSETAHMRVEMVPSAEFTQRTKYNFKVVYDAMVKNPRESVKIMCSSAEEAKRLQRGFHCSTTGRKLKAKGWKVQTSCADNLLQVKLTAPQKKKGKSMEAAA